MNAEILSDREVLHPVRFDQGPRITRVQRFRLEGKTYEAVWWTEAGRVVRIDSKELTT